MKYSRIRPGYGFWRTDHYPIGGCFDRAGSDGVVLKEVLRTFQDFNGVNTEGRTLKGERVAFSSDHTDTVSIVDGIMLAPVN